MRVHVTKADIENSVQCHSGLCPIATAIKRKVDRSYVCVLDHNVRIGRRVYPLPPRAQTFIRKFDSSLFPYRTTKPIIFTLKERSSSGPHGE